MILTHRQPISYGHWGNPPGKRTLQHQVGQIHVFRGWTHSDLYEGQIPKGCTRWPQRPPSLCSWGRPAGWWPCQGQISILWHQPGGLPRIDPTWMWGWWDHCWFWLLFLLTTYRGSHLTRCKYKFVHNFQIGGFLGDLFASFLLARVCFACGAFVWVWVG